MPGNPANARTDEGGRQLVGSYPRDMRAGKLVERRAPAPSYYIREWETVHVGDLLGKPDTDVLGRYLVNNRRALASDECLFGRAQLDRVFAVQIGQRIYFASPEHVFHAVDHALERAALEREAREGYERNEE